MHGEMDLNLKHLQAFPDASAPFLFQLPTGGGDDILQYPVRLRPSCGWQLDEHRRRARQHRAQGQDASAQNTCPSIADDATSKLTTIPALTPKSTGHTYPDAFTAIHCKLYGRYPSPTVHVPFRSSCGALVFFVVRGLKYQGEFCRKATATTLGGEGPHIRFTCKLWPAPPKAPILAVANGKAVNADIRGASQASNITNLDDLVWFNDVCNKVRSARDVYCNDPVATDLASVSSIFICVKVARLIRA
ncbi:hypothetical protein C8R44DRAFT_871788 [Mycena epipterygia]|nr:hypothetical protein C8R44DRAFT_871788 [Mycena epipterygia]